MNKLKKWACRFWAMLFVGCFAANLVAQDDFVAIENTSFRMSNHERYDLKGMQMWYAPLLAQKGEFGDRQRLITELDTLKNLGINCIAVCPEKIDFETTDLQGMDYLLNELHKRHIKAMVLIEAKHAHNALKTLQLLANRVNKINKHPYKDDATILSWLFTDLPQTADDVDATALAKLCKDAKLIDNKHLVSAQYVLHKNRMAEDEGTHFQRILSIEDLDFLSVSFMPAHDGWVTESNLIDGLGNVYLRLNELIDVFNRQASRNYKPFVALCGYPRDGMFTLPGSRTDARNAFFSSVLLKWQESCNEESPFCGIVWYGWGGTARPVTEVWQDSDAHTAEQHTETERKGMYSIFDNDYTIDIIKDSFK